VPKFDLAQIRPAANCASGARADVSDEPASVKTANERPAWSISFAGFKPCLTGAHSPKSVVGPAGKRKRPVTPYSPCVDAEHTLWSSVISSETL